MRGLRSRSDAPELMDEAGVDLVTFEHCLMDLERINRWTGAYRMTLGWLDRLVATRALRRLEIVDVGSGYGDMLRRIRTWASRRGLDVALTGVDRNPHAAAAATRATPPAAGISYVAADVFELPDDLRPDVVISALFAHHLDDPALVRFLRWMEDRSRLGWLINDLHRHPVPYAIGRLAPSLLRMNRLVRHDAAVSVARAFTRPDWERLLEIAALGAPAATVTWRFPFRYTVGRIKAA
jgi:SAM-dependent methyltransferase